MNDIAAAPTLDRTRLRYHCVSSGSESTGSGTLLAMVHGRLEPTSAVVFLTKWFNLFFAIKYVQSCFA